MRDAPPSFDDGFAALAAIAYRVAFRILGDRTEAEDVAQEALARAYVRWSRIEDHAEPWVAKVAANVALKMIARRGRPVPAAAAVTPGDLDTVALTRLGLASALETLPRRQREV